LQALDPALPAAHIRGGAHMSLHGNVSHTHRHAGPEGGFSHDAPYRAAESRSLRPSARPSRSAAARW
jgi:hypothetical protein